MGTISARVPSDLEDELEAYLDAEKLDRSTAVRKLLAEGLEEWRQQQALKQFEAGELTALEAANRAGMSVWEFPRLARSQDVTWVDEAGLATDLDDL